MSFETSEYTAYGMYACNGILFNHESPIRGETFVTRDWAMRAGTLRREFLHVDDLADACLFMLREGVAATYRWLLAHLLDR